MERRLAGLERQFFQQNLVGSTHIVCALLWDAPLEPERVQGALAGLIRHYPVLSAALVADPYIRFQAQDQIPLPYEEEASEGEEWRATLARDLHRPHRDACVHLTHLRGSRSILLLGLNHAVADGLSSLTLARDLVALYNGEPLDVLPHGLGIENRLPDGFRGLRGWFRAFRFIFTLAKMGPALQIGQLAPTRHTESIGFTMSETTRLNQLARQAGSNFFALFSAIVLKSLHELYGGQEADGRLSLNTPVSLRQAAGIPEREIGVFLAGQLGLYQLQADTDVFALAKDCYAKLKAGIAAGHPFHLVRLARGHAQAKPPKVPTQISRHRPTASISNLGRVAPFPSAGKAALSEIHAVSAQSMKDPFAFVLCSYEDKTFVDLQYSYEKLGREAAERMLFAVRQKLADLSTNSLGSPPESTLTEIP